MQDRLDKLRSALAEAWLKTSIRIQTIRKSYNILGKMDQSQQEECL